MKKDHSVIFSSHILSEVSAVCDRVVIINKGEIKVIDTIENLEKKISSDDIINVKINASPTSAESIVKNVSGVKEILGTITAGTASVLRISVEGDTSAVQNSVISALVSNNIQILEITAEKPDLEEAFVKLVNQPSKRITLKDMVEEIEAEFPEKNKSEEEK